MAMPAFNQMPRKQQLMIVYGAPALIAVLLLYWAYKALGTLGPVDDPPFGFVSRDTPMPSLGAEIKGLQVQIDEQQAVIDRGPEVDRQLAALEGSIKMAQERLPRETEKAEMREVIDRLARDIPKDIGTVELRSVRIVDNTGAKGPNAERSIVFQAELRADQDGLLKYIDSLEKNQRFMAVRQLTIRGGQQRGDPATRKVVNELHSVSMEIVTYVYNPGKK